MNKTYGYCRISTAQQSIDRQVRNIEREYPDAHIIKEAYTGTTTARPKWEQLMRTVREGDTIVFDSVSRMSRNAAEGYEAYQDLYSRGVQLVYLKEHHIDTATYQKALAAQIRTTGGIVDYILEGVNRYLLELAKEQIRLAFEQAEKEVQDLHQRTKEGIETARLAGKQIGQRQGAKLTTKKSVAAKEQIRRHSKDFGGSLTDAEVIQLTGLARNTYYKYKREIKEEGRV